MWPTQLLAPESLRACAGTELRHGGGQQERAPALLRGFSASLPVQSQVFGPGEGGLAMLVPGRTPGRAVHLGRHFASDQLGVPGRYGSQAIRLAGEYVGRARERRS